jgi:hypothetical protein
VLQAQVRLPGVLVHVACGSHPPLPDEHSLTSVQAKPSPLKPVLHAQVRLPCVLVHVA